MKVQFLHGLTKFKTRGQQMALPFSHQFPTGPFGNRVPKAQQQIIIQGSKSFCGRESGWWHQIQGNKKGLQLLANP
jgi:hypothetical protein